MGLHLCLSVHLGWYLLRRPPQTTTVAEVALSLLFIVGAMKSFGTCLAIATFVFPAISIPTAPPLAITMHSGPIKPNLYIVYCPKLTNCSVTRHTDDKFEQFGGDLSQSQTLLNTWTSYVTPGNRPIFRRLRHAMHLYTDTLPIELKYLSNFHMP